MFAYEYMPFGNTIISKTFQFLQITVENARRLKSSG